MRIFFKNLGILILFLAAFIFYMLLTESFDWDTFLSFVFFVALGVTLIFVNKE